jgi:hypothetical protein
MNAFFWSALRSTLVMGGAIAAVSFTGSGARADVIVRLQSEIFIDFNALSPTANNAAVQGLPRGNWS